MDVKLNTERRKETQRRLADMGPPEGLAERRINIERRLFNFSFDGASDWGTGSNSSGARESSASH